jgi:hypothetical protein
MEYKITSFSKEKGTVSITVTFDDKTTYDKRMMCDLSSEESINSTIKKWLSDYAPMREAEKEKEAVSYDPTPLVNKKVSVSKKQLEDIKLSIAPIASVEEVA